MKDDREKSTHKEVCEGSHVVLGLELGVAWFLK